MSPTDFPEPPDPRRIAEVREQLDREKSRRNAERLATERRFSGRINGRMIQDVGAYTLIPALLLAGPIVGYILGRLVESRWGGSPWGVVLGTMFGLVASFRQIYLILAKKTAPPTKKKRIK